MTRVKSLTHAAGYTLIEMLVSTAVMAIATVAILSVVTPSQHAFQARSESADLQQRLRFVHDALSRDIASAGAGPDERQDHGAMAAIVATIVPRRVGAIAPDSPSTAAGDRISLMSIPAPALQTFVRTATSAGASTIDVEPQAGCAPGHPLCWIDLERWYLLYDASGAYEVVKIATVDEALLRVTSASGPLSKSYPQGSPIAPIARTTYWFDATNARLMKYDGDVTDLPLADNVVSLAFAYFADPIPPQLTRPLTDPIGPWTTYGPAPPPPDVDDPQDTWAAGENCVFQTSNPGFMQIPRLGVLGDGSATLVPLASPMMADGPWCPDPAAPNRYDADLLRIRLVRVTVRVQSAIAALRGPAGVMFARGGTASGPHSLVPDQQITFDVVPRNLNLRR